MIKFWWHKYTERGFCCINREKVKYGAIASYVNEGIAADVAYIRVNSHVNCKMESEFFCTS